jgi:hypothetical protein
VIKEKDVGLEIGPTCRQVRRKYGVPRKIREWIASGLRGEGRMVGRSIIGRPIGGDSLAFA